MRRTESCCVTFSFFFFFSLLNTMLYPADSSIELQL